MSEQDRIRQMVEDGRISPEEAELLLEALGDVEEAGADIDSRVESEQMQGPEASAAGAPAPPPPPAPPPGPEASRSEPSTQDAAAALHWLKVDMLAGDLQIRVDESLAEPRIDGEADISRSGKDVTVRQERQKGFLDGILSMRHQDLYIALPPGYGVELKLLAGDVDVRGVPFLKGSMLSGDLNASEIGGIDLDMKAGDLDIGLRPSEGRHRLHSLAGDMDVRILSGASLEVEAEVLAGDIHAPFGIERRLMGGRVKGKVGSGRAQLDIKLKAGDLDLEVEGE